MQAEGPILESLTHRLADTPQDFLGEPRIGSHGQVHTGAVAGDLIRMLGQAFDPAALSGLEGADPKRDRNRLAVVLILCWLLADEWFRASKPAVATVLELLRQGAAELGAQVPSQKFMTDPDRREEL